MKYSSYQIGELFEQIRNGLTVENDSKSGGLPITRIETIANGEIDLVRVGYSGIEVGEKDGWLLEEGDILFSHINSLSHIGKCAIYKGVPEKLIHGMNLLSFRAKKEILLPEYARYLFRSNMFKSKLAKSIKPSVNQASVGIKDIQKIPVDIPPLATQKHIARVLEQAEQLRKQAQQMESELNQLVQSLFLEIFGDPVRNPKGWSRKRLSDVAKLARGRFSARPRNDPQFYGGQYPFIQTGTVVASDTHITTHEQTLNDKGLAVSKIFPSGTIAITIAANIGATAILTYPTCFPDSVVGITAGSELGVEFLEYQLRFFKQQLDSGATETAQKNINLQVLEPLMMIVPPRKEQEKFVGAYKLIHEQLTLIRNTKLEAANGFNSLMQRAFNGELTAPERKAA